LKLGQKLLNRPVEGFTKTVGRQPDVHMTLVLFRYFGPPVEQGLIRSGLVIALPV